MSRKSEMKAAKKAGYDAANEFSPMLKSYLTGLLRMSGKFASLTTRGDRNRVIHRINFEQV